MKHLSAWIFLFSFFFFLFSFFSPSYAGFWERDISQYIDDAQRPEEEVFIDRAVSSNLDAIQLGIIKNIIPVCKEDGKICLTKRTAAIPFIGSTIAMLYDNPPASGIAWTRETLASAGIIAKPAYAQGIGFAALSPFLPLWRATRNIAYTLLIAVMVIIGFMIMFRASIDPKTAISIQAALPKIIFSLILITFSYPIVGFMIDLMYLIIGLLVSVFVGALPNQTLAGFDIARWQSDMMTGGFFTLLQTVFGAGMRALSPDDLSKFWGIGVGTGITGGAAGGIAGIGAFSTISSIIMGSILGVLAPVLIILVIISLGLLFVFLRLLMLLANAYIQIIINLILGPLILLNEAIPGRSGFGNWMLTILANLSVFPTIALVLMFATFLTTQGVGGSWTPPFLPSGGTAFGQGFFSAFLGLSVIFLAPTLVGGVKKMFGAQSPLPISAGTVFAPVTGATQTAMGAATQYYHFGQLWGSHGQPGPLQGIAQAFGWGGGKER